jgi:MFS family permease
MSSSSPSPLTYTNAIKLGTIIPTLSPPAPGKPPAGSPSTHVTIVALTSTLARLLTGTLSDLLSPTVSPHQHLSSSQELPPHPDSNRYTLSRIPLLLTCTGLSTAGLILLAAPIVQYNPYLFPITTAMVGTGYGATFALVPIIISVVWGVENFGTNWGVVATVPAIGAGLWGLVYSACYERFSDERGACYGWGCYGGWAVGCTVAMGVAVGLWVVAWRGWKRRGVVV